MQTALSDYVIKIVDFANAIDTLLMHNGHTDKQVKQVVDTM